MSLLALVVIVEVYYTDSQQIALFERPTYSLCIQKQLGDHVHTLRYVSVGQIKAKMK